MRTIVKMLITTLVLILGAGLLIPAIVTVREAAYKTQCVNNMRQIGIALHSYRDAYRCVPQAAMPNAALPPDERLGWLVAVIPFIEASNIYNKMNKEEGWQSEENRFAALTVIRTYRCPSFLERTPTSSLVPTHYVGIAGCGTDAAALPIDDARSGFFGYNRKLTVKQMRQPAATLAMAIETGQTQGSWTAAGPATVRALEPDGPPYLGNGGQFGGLHRSGTNALFADASVGLLPPSMKSDVFEAMATLHGRDGVSTSGEE